MEKRLGMVMVGLFLCIGMVLAQTKTTGTVISGEDGESIIGTSVLIKGTTAGGTVTDIGGHFTLNTAEGTTIVISYVDMETQTLKTKNGMKVTLRPDQRLVLDEVVVTGMTSTDRGLFSGAATKIDAKGAKISGMADISRSLEGRAAGVSVQNVSGTFGTTPKVRVRGATSIHGSLEPLWVVDGVVMEDVVDVSAEDLSSGDVNTLISSTIAGLNSDDIESFQILKDGSATSIYDARVMAGVIVITTKKGKAGQSHISYTGEYTMRLRSTYSTFNIMNSQDQMSIYRKLEKKGFLNYAETANAMSSDVHGKIYQMLSEYNKETGQFALANTEKAKNAYPRAAEFRNTNWFKDLFSTAIMRNHSVSISDGTEKSQYYASLSAIFGPGWTKQNRVQRYTANINTTYNLNEHFDINLVGNASCRKQQAPGALNSDVDLVTGEVKRDFDINPYSYALNTSRMLDPSEFCTRSYAPFNIFHGSDNNYMDLHVSDFRVQASIDYRFIRKLKIILLGSAKNSPTPQEHNILDESNQAMAYRAMPTTAIRDRNPSLYKDPDNIYALPIPVLPYGGIYERRDSRFFGRDTRLSASYNDVFNDTHILNLYGGMETNLVNRKFTWFRGRGLQYSQGEVPLYAYQVLKKGRENGSDYFAIDNTHIRSAAFFGMGTYSYEGRYQLTGTIRHEGTNYLGKVTSARWMSTQNLSSAWNAYEESWYEGLFKDVLIHSTLRVSYSLAGDRPAITNALPIFRSPNPWRLFTNVQEPGLNQVLGNPELTYEKKYELNFGFDLGFLKNRINLSADFCWCNNYDLIDTVNTELYGLQYANVVSMKSNGMEFSLSTTSIKTEDFTWSTNLICSHSHNEITEPSALSRVIDTVQGTGFAKEGYPIHSVFSVPFRGLNREGLPTLLDQDGNVATAGIYFQGRDPEKVKFLKYEGSAEPTDVGLLGNIFRYKNWTLNVFSAYSFGNVVRLDPVFSNEYNDLSSMPKEFRNHWEVSGDERKTSIPVIAGTQQNRFDKNPSYAYNAYNYSDARIAKGDFIRMKELFLGYDFPNSVRQFLSVNTLSLKLQATNLFLLYADSKLNGQDPESFSTGGVAAPVPKQSTLTLRLGL